MKIAALIPRARIRSWRAFSKRVATGERPLLRELPRYPRAVLVAGCQRSGTTAVTRVIAGTAGFCKFRISHDDELDAALILAGEEQFEANARVCFQTTYLNDSFLEYIDSDADFKLVWVVRNPYSVVYSMVYHWRPSALDRLYSRCGVDAAREAGRERNDRWRAKQVSRLEKACFSYVGKTRQLEELAASLPADRLKVIDYDQLCRDPADSLAGLFAFIGEPFDRSYAERIHSQSIAKESRLTDSERELIGKYCKQVHDRSLKHVR